MVGHSHGIHAEPITFGFKLAGWLAEVMRNRDRLLYRVRLKQFLWRKCSKIESILGKASPQV